MRSLCMPGGRGRGLGCLARQPHNELAALARTFAVGLQIPAADQLTYAPTAYRVSQTISLDLVLPGAPATDGVSCP